MLTATVSCSNIKLRHHHASSTVWDTTSEDDDASSSAQIIHHHHTTSSDTSTNNDIFKNNNLFEAEMPPSETSSSELFDLNHNGDDDDFEKFHKRQNSEVESSRSGKNCKTCQNQGVKMTEEELTALRIEFVKNQILKKLRLTERPNVSIKDLPKPITEKLVPFPDTENVNRQVEDYYGKTTKKFIFLQEGMGFMSDV